MTGHSSSGLFFSNYRMFHSIPILPKPSFLFHSTSKLKIINNIEKLPAQMKITLHSLVDYFKKIYSHIVILLVEDSEIILGSLTFVNIVDAMLLVLVENYRLAFVRRAKILRLLFFRTVFIVILLKPVDYGFLICSMIIFSIIDRSYL